jgi:hypothetical protein
VNRRQLLGGLVGIGGGLLVPAPKRIYSFAPAAGWPVAAPPLVIVRGLHELQGSITRFSAALTQFVAAFADEATGGLVLPPGVSIEVVR